MPFSDDLWARTTGHDGPVRAHMAFFGSWLRRPLRVAALAPSGRPLARLITDWIEPGAGPVLELGAGTGAFTAELLAKGVAAKDIHVIEMDDRLAEVLSERFPEVQVTVANATSLSRDAFPTVREFAAAISGLPVLALSAPEQIRILSGVFRRMGPGGALYQFTYGPRCPFSAQVLARLGLRGQRVGGVVRNLPPASVYRISRHVSPPTITAIDDDVAAVPPTT